jgi:hypothetical protein
MAGIRPSMLLISGSLLVSQRLPGPSELREQGVFVVYYEYFKALSPEVERSLKVGEAELWQRIAKKFQAIGVRQMVFRPMTDLTPEQTKGLMEAGRDIEITGIGFLFFAGKEFENRSYKVFGATDARGVSVVFVGNLLPELPGLTFRVAEVASHELGHGQSFTSSIWTLILYPVRLCDLMCEGMPLPVRPLEFDKHDSRTRRAVEIINGGRQRGVGAAR